mmetsp:Transcript_17046/g.22116  ORF Transcript_17046/g.22116 Transcript_17046/m.22116 type:complete len:283 (-) Transcript_17046:23-871(-)
MRNVKLLYGCLISLVSLSMEEGRFCTAFSVSSSANFKGRIRTFMTSLRALDRSNLEEAERLLEQARKLRESIPQSNDGGQPNTKGNKSESLNLFEGDESIVCSYRLYVDIGREEGTWMDPKWGASGKRIPFTVDIGFSDEIADFEVANKMVKDNFSGKSSDIKLLKCLTKNARLRGGFDKMKVSGGGYRIDNKTTVRFYITCEGNVDEMGSSSYGDIHVPKGELYFSIPCFMNNVSNLSSKEFPGVTVRQKGWHTGWFREESRMVGTFKMVPLAKARENDNF